jgi:hypothetical protein
MEETQFISTNNILDFVNSINNLPAPLQNQLPKNYGYLWAKSSLMKNIGFEKYATGDYFKFPLKQWINKDFESVVNQIVNDLNGFSSESPIEISDTITMHHFLYTKHYKIDLIQVDAKHFIEDDEITLYFIQKKFNFL